MTDIKIIEALQPFADAVFNDNGDITVNLSAVEPDDFIKAYFALRQLSAAPALTPAEKAGVTDRDEQPSPVWWQDEEAAEREFTDYFCRNYPEPVLDDPAAHAAVLFRAAKRALLATKVRALSTTNPAQGDGVHEAIANPHRRTELPRSHAGRLGGRSSIRSDNRTPSRPRRAGG